MNDNFNQDPETPPEPTIDERFTALLEKYQAISEEHAVLKQEVTQRRIMDELTAVAQQLEIPDIIIQHDLQRYVVDFAINKENNVVLRQDETQDIKAVLSALQKERPHWKSVRKYWATHPLTHVAFGNERNEPQRGTGIANNFAAEVERQATTWFDR
jgi:hypothetical protein